MSDTSGDPGHSEDIHEPRKRVAASAGKLTEVFVFAPIGFLSEAGRLWPEVVAAGREHVDTARAMREGAITQAREWVISQAGSGRSEASAAIRGLGLTGGGARLEGDVAPGDSAPTSATRSIPVETPPTVPSPGPAPHLAIPDYDLLSASQVVPRLDALAPDELEAVRLHEHASRSRRTILSKIAQLQAG